MDNNMVKVINEIKDKLMTRLIIAGGFYLGRFDEEVITKSDIEEVITEVLGEIK